VIIFQIKCWPELLVWSAV